MATVVLTAVGSLVGGPIGAAVGSAIGGVIDREVLFKPKGREGPRLSELRVQSSSYGTQIPQMFGTMRVAGSVIWATDLVEHRSTDSGKGRPSVTSYSYTASFAVALSSRPIRGVGRIWADGTLLRGAAGDWKSATGFRLHLGGEDQAVDPLIASAEGGGLTPAHRGIAYAVFEDMALSDYGNRIPSLSFELIADEGAIAAGAVIETLGGGTILAGEAAMPVLRGYSAYGSDARAAIETLADVSGGWFRSDGGGLTLMAGPGDAVAVCDDGVRAPERTGAGRGRSIAAADQAPRTLSLSHYEPARDYQAGLQRVARPGAGNRESRIELPAALDAGAAKTLAEAALARLDLERERRTVTLPWTALSIRPGDRVSIDGASGQWRVDRWSLETMVVTLDCVAVAPPSVPAAASGGRVLAAADRLIGETRVHAFELPPLGDVAATLPRLAIAAAGTEPGWRRAALLVSTDAGASWTSAGSSAVPAVLGQLVVPPGAAPATLVDRRNSVVVELSHAGMRLEDADAARLAAGANLAMLGDELIQFERAQPLGDRHWRLSGLWRGRRGTETAIGTQLAGARFVLLTAETLVTMDLPPGTLGGQVRVVAQGVGEGDTGEAVATIGGISVLPPAPVRLAAERRSDGALRLSWVRRSRLGWDWPDGVDAPVAEERERYRVTITDLGGERMLESDAPELALVARDWGVGTQIAVRQIGSHGLSPAATLIL
jgi:hypothetical protein